MEDKTEIRVEAAKRNIGKMEEYNIQVGTTPEVVSNNRIASEQMHIDIYNKVKELTVDAMDKNEQEIMKLHNREMLEEIIEELEEYCMTLPQVMCMAELGLL